MEGFDFGGLGFRGLGFKVHHGYYPDARHH